MSRRYGSFTIRPRLARPCYQQSPDEPGDRRTFEGIASRKHLCTVHRNGNLSIAAVQVLLASSGLTPYRCTAVTLEGWALVLRFRATDALSAHTAVGVPLQGLGDTCTGVAEG